MSFNSLPYLCFLPVVYLLYYFTVDRWRWLVLLLASCGFYASLHAYYLLGVLVVVTCVSYCCAIHIAACTDPSGRSRWFWAGSFTCVATLALVKYLPFLQCPPLLRGLKSSHTSAIISIGVSYFTFQAISYLVDIYLELEEPEVHPGRYALYLAFFPKLLQGPIERAGDLLPQLKKSYAFDYDTMRSGLLLFAWGLFKKVVLADRFGLYADAVFGNVTGHSGLVVLLGTYAYAFQIYFDFAGYTDMARGGGRIFGLNLTENFNSPYLSTSIAEFWRRWHISFSRWILDYIFKPLQMSWRGMGQAGTALALLIAFLISGIWHGASWGFLLWGALHGSYLAASTYYRTFQKQLHNVLHLKKSRVLRWWQVLFTFNLVNVTWVFFRARSVPDALAILRSLFVRSDLPQLRQFLLMDGYIGLPVLLFALLVYNLLETPIKMERVVACHYVPRWCAYTLIFFGLLLLGSFHTSSEFIYYQF